nr:fluoride export protein 1-like isoform X2 [Populus alba]
MDRGTNEPEPNLSESFRQTSSVVSSVRRRFLSLSRSRSFQVDDDIESENVSEAGDIGDRALHSNSRNESGSISLSIDSGLENGMVFPISNDNFLRSNELWAHDSTALNTRSSVLPSPEEIMSPISTDAVVCSREKQEVLTRYLLQKLFGPDVAGVTSDNYPLYLDLPSNMVGSFLMGWWGVVFKEDISKVSGHLTIGLTTGYLGSLTTFSGWNQKMLDLSVSGHWVFSFVGFLIGLFLAAYSIKLGIGTAKCFKSFFQRSNRSATLASWRVDNPNHHFAVMVVLVVMLGLLWALSGAMLKEEYNHDSSGAQLWLGCIVAPLGVWIRWFLARLNGRGLGKAGSLKWIPFGTLIANVSAACIMAALSTVKKAVHTKTCDTISTGIQFGFLGCLSTVSTFIAEYNAMEESQKSWRAYVYALITIIVSFSLGTLIYSVPVWSRGYK